MGLVKNVQVDGVWYGPAYGSTEIGEGIPEDVAGKMGMHLWAPGTAPEAEKAEPEPEAKPRVEGARRRSSKD